MLCLSIIIPTGLPNQHGHLVNVMSKHALLRRVLHVELYIMGNLPVSPQIAVATFQLQTRYEQLCLSTLIHFFYYCVSS
jgi:hypothetical protein